MHRARDVIVTTIAVADVADKCMIDSAFDTRINRSVSFKEYVIIIDLPR